MRTSTLALAASIPIFALIATGASRPERGLANRVAELEAQVEELTAAQQEAQEILQFVHVETERMNGLRGPHWIVEGVNVHVRSGSGDTNDGCSPLEPDYPNCEILTGLGNLIVGYNKRDRTYPHRPGWSRRGSHNLVVGYSHTYSSFGGFVVGSRNIIAGPYASVTGGRFNIASGDYSSVSGGAGSDATGIDSSVSGGHRNVASGAGASVSGGQDREAPDDFNWAAGELFEEN